jgi:ssDNA-binding Zn-finger/Zn-ribbon topoisomerase 1
MSEHTIEDTLCPECGGPMVSRKNSATGQRFWGCRKFPECKGTRDTDGEARHEVTRRDYGLPSERQRWNDRGRWRS